VTPGGIGRQQRSYNFDLVKILYFKMEINANSLDEAWRQVTTLSAITH